MEREHREAGENACEVAGTGLLGFLFLQVEIPCV